MVVPSILVKILLFSLFRGNQASWNSTGSPVDTVKYLCERHSFALSGTFSESQDKDKGQIHGCSLTFDMEVDDQDDANDACTHMLAAKLIKASSSASVLTCEYQFMFLCPTGMFPIDDICVRINDTQQSFESAKSQCGDGTLPDPIYASLMKNILYTINPLKTGFRSKLYWVEKDTIVPMGRGLDSWTPGETVAVRGKDQLLAGTICLFEPMKSKLTYENRCSIVKNVLKIPASFFGGNCYMLSSSVHAAPWKGGVPQPGDLHSQCQWFSAEDRAVTPMSQTRRDAIDSVLVNYARHQFTYILTTSASSPGSTGEGNWGVANVDGKITPINKGAYMWESGRPRMEDGDTLNTQAVVLPKSTRGSSLLRDVPLSFRGRLMCAAGASQYDMAFKKCEDGWATVLRDDGKVACFKGFKDELRHKNNEYARDFCKRQGNGFLAPMESADEQKIVIDIVKSLGAGKGAMWLGATRNQANSRFYWDLDRRIVTENEAGGSNWNPGEPNNYGNGEHCLQIYTHKGNTWNDIYCTVTTGTNSDDGIVGGVCARYRDP